MQKEARESLLPRGSNRSRNLKGVEDLGRVSQEKEYIVQKLGSIKNKSCYARFWEYRLHGENG